MALVKTLEKTSLEINSPHSEVDCTYSIIKSEEGDLLQIDTYGSKTRKIPGKKSQSLRFSREAMKQLADILKTL